MQRARRAGRARRRSFPSARLVGALVVPPLLLVSGCSDREGADGSTERSTPSIARFASEPAGGIGTTIADPPTAPPEVPGVELRPVDGGPDYFGQWTNSFPTDPGFFPVSVWAETLDGTGRLKDYEALGVNTFSNLWGGPTPEVMDRIKAHGLYAIAGTPDARVTEEFDAAYGNHLAAHYFQDEGDGRDVCGDQVPRLAALCRPSADGRTSPDALQDMADAIRDEDPTRPVYGQFTKPVALLDYLSEPQARAYVDGADIVSYDWYPLTDPYTPGQLWEQADAVQTTRRLANYAKPVWPAIETSYVFANSARRPGPAEVAAEVWNALIGGARGIQYFNHSFRAGHETTHVLLEPEYQDVAAAVRVTNLRIAELAPVLNADYAHGFVKVTKGTVNQMTKAHDGSFFLFVAARSERPQDVTLDLTGVGDTSATVLYEDRSVEVTDGRLTDTFDGAEAVHVYRIDPERDQA